MARRTAAPPLCIGQPRRTTNMHRSIIRGNMKIQVRIILHIYRRIRSAKTKYEWVQHRILCSRSAEQIYDEGYYGATSTSLPPVPFVRVVKRRTTANKKERRRTQSINSAFTYLRDCIPNVPSDTKLSKVRRKQMNKKTKKRNSCSTQRRENTWIIQTKWILFLSRSRHCDWPPRTLPIWRAFWKVIKIHRAASGRS